MSTHHHLHASPQTCHWGYFDAALPPVLTIADGDRVTVETVGGALEDLPPPGFHVPPELTEIHAALGPHILTGPIAVAGAEPGDVLQVDIEAVSLRQDWGYNKTRPLMGALPEDFPSTHAMTIALDAPLAETPTHLITHGFAPDLDRCTELALRRMIAEIVARTGISREWAYALVSIAGDLHVTQIVNQHKSVHCMVAKNC
jgi:acetamidase/formamidase